MSNLKISKTQEFEVEEKEIKYCLDYIYAKVTGLMQLDRDQVLLLKESQEGIKHAVNCIREQLRIP